MPAGRRQGGGEAGRGLLGQHGASPVRSQHRACDSGPRGPSPPAEPRSVQREPHMGLGGRGEGWPSHKSYAAPARLNGQTVTRELEILGRDISGSITF